MSGNLTKSEAGWVRLRENVASRRGVRGAQLDARVKPRKRPEAEGEKAEVNEERETFPNAIVRKGRVRRRVVIGR